MRAERRQARRSPLALLAGRLCLLCAVAPIPLWAPPGHADAVSLRRLTVTPGLRESFPAFVDGPRIAYLRRAGAGPAWKDELWIAGANGAGARRVLGPGCFHLRVSHSRRLWVGCSRYVEVRPVGPTGAPVGWGACTEVWAAPVGNPRPVRVAGPGSWFLDGWSRGGALSLHEGRLGYDDLQGFHEATGFPPIRAWQALPWVDGALRPLDAAASLAPACERADWSGLCDAGVWSPSGKECIRVARFRRRGKAFIGYDVIRPGKPPRRLLDSEEYLAPGPRPWLPAVVWLDSSRVLLQRFHAAASPQGQGDGTFSLVVVHAGSGAARVFAPMVRPAPIPDPVPSPSGDRILLRSRSRSGSHELWVAASSGKHAKRVLGADAGYSPWAWSPDGRSLVVTRRDGSDTDLWRIDLGRP